MGPQEKYHFVLVHGAYHGAWCWFKLIDRLQNEGHQVTGLDMAGAGQHPADPNTIATYEQYNQPVTDFFESLPKEDPSKVVVIGHSMGGLSCMQLTERFAHKIGLVIYVATVVTPSGVSVMDCSQLRDVVLATILVRPVPSQILATPIMCTKEKYGQVPKVSLPDNALTVAAQDWIGENARPFNEVVEMDGGHFLFHVKMDDFTQLVYRLAGDYFHQG